MTSIENLYLKGFGYKKIAKELKLSVKTVLYSLIDLGYYNVMSLPDQDIINKIIEDYKTLSIKNIMKKYNMSSPKIHVILKLNNVEITPSAYHKNYKNKVNHDFFDIIDTEEKAYWLGFLYADGYNDTKFYQVELSLKEEDFDMVNLFRSTLSSSYKITKRKINLNDKIFYSYRHIIYSKKLSKRLEELGCPKNKSLILKFPDENIVPNNLIHHFMRGYFDGDGCVSGTKFMLNGTKQFLDSYIEVVRNNTDISKAGYWSMDGKAYRWSHAGKKDLKLIGNFLYKDAHIYLKRKYERFNALPL
nr:MAG TPA: endonuclease [Bacteriophage sp.]